MSIFLTMRCFPILNNAIFSTMFFKFLTMFRKKNRTSLKRWMQNIVMWSISENNVFFVTHPPATGQACSRSWDRNTHSCKWTAVFICYPIRTAYSIFFFTFFFFTYRTWSLWRWLNIPPWQYHNSYLGLAVYRVAKVEGLQDWRSTKG